MDTKYINEILTKDIQSLGCTIWGVELFGRHKNQTLRIYIDNKEGVSIEDCEKVSKHVIKVLDADNDFSSKYLLEVSSPGLDRKFFFDHQYQDYIDCGLKVKYINDSRDKVSVKGIITKVTESELLLVSGEETIEVPFSSIIQANLIM
jgi:ribosome maturation factor RimP